MGSPTVRVQDQIDETLRDFAALPLDPPSKRNICERCRRPASVCWCAFLPSQPLNIQSTVIILQHPSEEKRCLRTSPMLIAALPPEKCHIVPGRHFSPTKSPFLHKIFTSPHTLLLYPGNEATDLLHIPPISVNGAPYNLVVVDGTWAQARSLYHSNHSLHKLRQVMLCNTGLSEYVIRTQPTDNSLSTVETVAMSLTLLEENLEIKELLLKPLQALCRFQLEHGAVEHQSKEGIIQGADPKRRLPKKTRKRLKQGGVNLGYTAPSTSAS